MNEQQINKLGMGNTTHNVCRKNADLIATIPVLNTKDQNLETVLNEIKATRLLQDIDTKGITQDKAAIESALIDKVVFVCSGLAVYAKDNNNNVLLNIVNVSRSSFRIMRDPDCLSKCKEILNELKKVSTGLKDYGITCKDETELEQLINEYEAQITAPRETTSDKTAATAKLEELFKKFDSILDDMDSLMKQFEKSQPDFFNSYTTARKIVDLG